MRLYFFTYTLLALQFSCSSLLAANQIIIKITPEKKIVQDNIKNYIGEYEGKDKETLLRLQRIVKQQATEACQALGYYEVDVLTEVTDDKTPKLNITVNLGKPVRLKTVYIEITGQAAALKTFSIPTHTKLKPNAVLNHAIYESAKSQIQTQALRYGFFFGQFTTHQIRINPEEKLADIKLSYESGPRTSLGQVTFKGKNPFDEKLLKRFIPFQPGTPYDSELLSQFTNDLQSSGYFDYVRIDATPSDEEHLELPVTAYLLATKPRVLETGLGFSTDVGPRASLNWRRPWVNSKGHQLGFGAEVSAKRQNITSWYQIPLKNPVNDNLRFTAGLQREDIVDTKSTLWTVGAELNKKLASGWTRTLFLRYQNETYTIDDEDTQSRSFLMPGVSYSYLRSDSNVDPSKGYRLQFELSGAKKEFLSKTDFIRYSALLKGLYTFKQKHRTLARFQVGSIETPEFKYIPPSLRFYTGGDQSVRGYNYQTLSPKDNKNNKVGGRYLVVGSLEYQYAIAEKWRLATFVDQGNAIDSFSDKLKTGVGVGVRWVSPVGPIRIDLAHGIDDNSLKIHFSMGPEL